MVKNIVIGVLGFIAFMETMYIKEVQGYLKAVKVIAESNFKKEEVESK